MMRLHYWIALAVITTSLTLGYTVFSHSALPHLWQMNVKADALRDRMVSLYDELAAISAEIELLSDSTSKGRAFLKRVAREELGMIGPGEILVTIAEPSHEKNVHP
jgi:cell division protein FtsB